MKLSICGLDCETCSYVQETNCPGCHACKGKMFWGECDVYLCAINKNLPHCGKCEEFPCAMLKDLAAGEGAERIDNLKALEETV